ncbi:hypothetical protein JV173_02965 [Acholeplasma equirhinis]|uniref:hypothetical protein n=1 Tax=Acholeplasma equirhinis TaxID=555393 RepID=UPI00197AD462|nr:hypothetical protein [Acholeplasma equirhinis]MBN3490470.1 hypothetical protein [Acholeplasma equirhinis]
MKKNQKLMLAVLFLLAVVSLGISYAYWASIELEADVDGNVVTIGTGRISEVSASALGQTDGVLVPAGQAANSLEDDAVEYVMFKFQVVWESNDADSEKTGVVTVAFDDLEIDHPLSSILVDYVSLSYQIGGTHDDGTFNGDGDYAIEGNGGAVTVWVKVVLLEPMENLPGVTKENAEDYAKALFGSEITFTVLFTVIED